MKKISIALSFILLLQCSCGAKKMATKVIGAVSTDGMVAIESEQDVDFARESLPSLIKTLEVLRYGDIRDLRTLVLLSKAYGTYTFGFIEEDLLVLPQGSAMHIQARERAELFYRRGKEFGIAALLTKSGMHDAFKAPFPEFKKAIDGLGKKYVPALFWTAFNWANWMNLNRDDPAAVVNAPKVVAMAERVLELDPDYYYGSAHALRGLMAATRPKMLGGDPELANKELRKAMETAPDYLMTKVLYAQYYARQTNDKPLFREELTQVMNANAGALQEQRLANELAQRRAKILMKQEDDLF
ncbi:MAG: TRAP transporter TatT component family protein [Pseudomonadota bacterium]